MNRANLKNYAPLARRDFIQAMKDRAAFYGLTASKVEPVVELGDVAVIAGREHPRAVVNKRKQLEARIQKQGFEQTMEAMAYTWFNRLVAIRFMELHGYLDHGYRVLSHPEGKSTPEILEHAEHVEFPGLKRETIIDLKVAGNKEDQLYRLLLSAQCNALHSAMPFLFERFDDSTELLIPDNLLHSDSLIRKLVNEIDEEDWQQVEIIGWLYQFYISEKKDEVIGKVVVSEDIPAATQLFTPSWIVKYLVQNTLGRHWLDTYPQSALRKQMEYYIEPATQTPEVEEKLKAITPGNLDPEDLTLLDPACGSGHILVEAYILFKAIYQERGYRAQDIPALILKKNLFGLEIDSRAGQLAAFCLMMKARADDRRIFDSGAKPNILALEGSHELNATAITFALNSPIDVDDVPSEYLFEELQEDSDGLFSRKALPEKGYVSEDDVRSLMELFENAKTFGSLIQVPPKLTARLPEIARRLNDVLQRGDLTHLAAHVIEPLVRQACLLTKQYNVVVANPPYMGNKYMNNAVKNFALRMFSDSQADLFAAFVDRSMQLCFPNGQLGFVTPYVWMFISSYKTFRMNLLSRNAITSLIQLEYNAFEPACVPVCTFTLRNTVCPSLKGDFIRLADFKGHQNQPVRTLEAVRDPRCEWRFQASGDDFRKISGSPLAYWVSRPMRMVFADSAPLESISRPMKGMFTGNDARFVRFHWEVSDLTLDCASHADSAQRQEKWYPYLKGGDYRKWYGNTINVVNFQNDGAALKSSGKHGDRNPQHYFLPCLTWSDITISNFAVRFVEQGALPSSVGNFIVGDSDLLLMLSGLLCSKIATEALKILNPTFHANPGDVALIPFVSKAISAIGASVRSVAERAITLARTDWNASETSLQFGMSELIGQSKECSTLSESHRSYAAMLLNRISEMRQFEEENNRLFIQAYGLQEEISPEIPDEQVTLYRPNREEDIKRLLSYAIGCIMGRYSLDKLGLIYPRGRNQDFDPSQYRRFRADDDGIILLIETDWNILDDATNRVVEFIGLVWPKAHLEANLKFIADSLGPNNTEQPRDTIRRYLANRFYKHHLSIYKRRPIYWLFSSGKQRAFQCLVYLHRYHDGTLARMRTEYVIPLQGQIAARIEQLEGDKIKATSTSHRSKIQKAQADLKKQQSELAIFEEQLKHAADQKLALDLDDGVKTNYAKFGDLLAESKAVTGGKDDE